MPADYRWSQECTSVIILFQERMVHLHSCDMSRHVGSIACLSAPGPAGNDVIMDQRL
jgi:hypothetical protein